MSFLSKASLSDADLLFPDWPAPARVGAMFTTRNGGVSEGRYASLNLGAHVGDASALVAENRRRFTQLLPGMPAWLNQVHGAQVARAEDVIANGAGPAADASVATSVHAPCVVLVADCLPVLFADTQGTCVAAAHAGWRGLNDGVLEATVASMTANPGDIVAWLGPAIGPRAFEVGAEVRDAFLVNARDDEDATVQAFLPREAAYPDKYFADIYALARIRLARAGVTQIYGGGFCTVTDSRRFFSYRRDGKTGRMAAGIWLRA
jgi:polyphenol oxidase